MAALPTLNRQEDSACRIPPPVACGRRRSAILIVPSDIAYDWLHLGYGIALAGGAYPMLFGVAAILVGCYATSVSILSFDMVVRTIGSAIAWTVRHRDYLCRRWQ